MISLKLLFKGFLKIGATAYGGPAIAGHMKKTIVKDYGWISEQDFLQGLALCQMIPGATFVMLSSYIGYRLRGIWGAFLCPIGFVLPAFILLVIFLPFISKWETFDGLVKSHPSDGCVKGFRCQARKT